MIKMINLRFMVYLNMCFIDYFFTVGWGRDQIQGFGNAAPSVKSQVLNLIRSVRTVMRSKFI